MATSQYFNNVGFAGQQKLANDLLVEAIQQRGVDTHYLPRELLTDETIFNEAEETIYRNAAYLEFYIEEIINFNGEGHVFEKFGGFAMNDSAVVVCAVSRYEEEMAKLPAKFANRAPQAGDLIFIDFASQFFKVVKVLQDEDYRQWGKNYRWRLKIEKFVFGHEEFETNISDIDGLVEAYETPELDDLGIPTGVTETIYNVDIREKAKTDPAGSTDILDFGR